MNQTMNQYAKCLSICLLTGAFVISNGTPLLANPPQSSSAQSSSSQPSSTQPSSTQPNTVDSKPNDSLPDAPQTQTPANQQHAAAPSGAAGAKAANVKGAPVAEPAGAAVAPPRQRGHRSLLIKIGLLAGAGIAVGSAVALSERSPSRPPGTSSSTHPK